MSFQATLARSCPLKEALHQHPMPRQGLAPSQQAVFARMNAEVGILLDQRNGALLRLDLEDPQAAYMSATMLLPQASGLGISWRCCSRKAKWAGSWRSRTAAMSLPSSKITTKRIEVSWRKQARRESRAQNCRSCDGRRPHHKALMRVSLGAIHRSQPCRWQQKRCLTLLHLSDGILRPQGHAAERPVRCPRPQKLDPGIAKKASSSGVDVRPRI
jgi:hypothetical protein